MNVSAPVTPGLPDVLRDVTEERARQIAKGYTPDHDRACHSLHGLGVMGAQRFMQGVHRGTPGAMRDDLIAGVTILVAAVEAYDRQVEEDSNG